MGDATLPPGVLLIDKPIGITSFGAIRQLRRARGVKKMGHAGTLDPLASGLLIIAEGEATKLLSTYLKLPKVYEAEVCVGEATDTGDREGSIVEHVEVLDLPEDKVRNVLASMVGTLPLEVPKYSAIKQGGEALYKKARRGDVVQPPVKDMYIESAQLLSMRSEPPLAFVSIRLEVGSGTYIRSLAEEFGRRLGYPARLENLRRTQVGSFSIDDVMPFTFSSPAS